MKIGTAPEITVGAIGIIALLSVGIHQIILPKFFGTKHTASSVQTEAPSGLAEMEVNQQTEDSKNQRQFSDKEMEQINNFFAQFDATDAQSDMGEVPASTESKTEYATTDTDAESEDTEQSAEEVMNAYLDAFKNRDFEALLPLVTRSVKEQFEGISPLNGGFPEETIDDIVNKIDDIVNDNDMGKYMVDSARWRLLELMDSDRLVQTMQEQMLEIYGGTEIVGSEYVEDEFHFRLRMPMLRIQLPEPDTLDIERPEMPESPGVEQLIKMQKVDGVWQIYRIDGYEALN